MLAYAKRALMLGRPKSRRAATVEQPSDLLLSFPKSGRTWLGYLVAFYAVYQLRPHDADKVIDGELLTDGHLYRPLENPRLLSLLEEHEGATIPLVKFVHNFPAKPYFRLDLELGTIQADKAMLMTRDPRDVAVSY
jgi:hypothetical protein